MSTSGYRAPQFLGSNPDSSGRVVNIYWDNNGDSIADLVTKPNYTYIADFPTAGLFKVRVWADDNDGFQSPIDSTLIWVISNRPYRDALVRDTVVYRDTPVVFHPSFHPDAKGDSIIGYNWIVTGN